jgi:hypothetical protein
LYLRTGESFDEGLPSAKNSSESNFSFSSKDVITRSNDLFGGGVSNLSEGNITERLTLTSPNQFCPSHPNHEFPSTEREEIHQPMIDQL